MIFTSITLSILAVLLSVWLGRKNPVRSSGITSGMLVLLMLTPLLLILPKIEVSWLSSSSTRAQGSVITSNESLFFNGHILTSAWVIGTLFLLLRLLVHTYQIKRWCFEAETTASANDLKLLEQCAEQLNCSKLPEIRYTQHLSSPVITGLLNPILLLPLCSKKWSNETKQMVILHELGHLQRKDLWTNMAAHIACTIHWYNPLIWLLRKRLINECEYACDAHVISYGTDTKTYINALCDVAESCRQQLTQTSQTDIAIPATALAMANSASLKERVTNVLHGQQKNSRWLIISILALSSSATIAYTVVRPAKEDQFQKATEQQTSYSANEINTRLSANPFPQE